MTYPDDISVDDGDEEAGLDTARVSAARTAEASEADLIEQAMTIPQGDDDRAFDR